MNLAALLSTATLAVTEAETIIPAVDFFVKQAEASATTGTTGAQKFSAVEAALKAYITTNFPSLVETFDAVWKSLTGVINGLVSLYNQLGTFKTTVTA